MTEHTTATSDPKDTPSQDVKNTAPDIITGLLERFKLPGFDLEGFGSITQAGHRRCDAGNVGRVRRRPDDRR